MDTPIVGIFGTLLTVVAMFLGTVGVIQALLKQKRDLLKAILLGAAIWIAAYLLVLLSVSTVSHAQVLRPGLTVVDDLGTEYPRAAAAERELGDTASLERNLGPGESLVRRVVFDLPRSVRRPRLQFTEGYWIDRLIELFLIGDEDSLLHGKTTFLLQESG